ncbi:MAG: hypothetical protein M0Q12_01075 [Synergistaceae bacterium]|jgi:hypothetical protein|nr:hypothetical protein [Synergistaceae bacterium]
MDRKKYEEDLKQKQAEHLKNVRGGRNDINWQPCLHDGCESCHGTGVKLDGSRCFHNISCPCPKCRPSFI